MIQRHLLLTILFLAVAAPLASAGDWPHWRGEKRDGHTTEVSGWKEGAEWKPVKKWEAQLGEGSASVLVIGGKLYGCGWKDGVDTIHCLDADTGKVLWQQQHKAPRYGRRAEGDQNFFSGPCASPEFDPETGILYTLSCDGDLHAWDTAAKGAPVWHFNLYEKWNIPMRPQVTTKAGSHRDYGYTCAPLVYGSWLLVEAGDPEQGNVVALDKKTGKPVWWSEQRDPAGHCGGLVPMTIEGKPCVLSFTALNVLVMRLDAGSEGKTVAAMTWPTHYANNIATSAVLGADAFVTTRWNRKTARLHFSLTKPAATVWESTAAGNVCSPVLSGDNLYWAQRGITCQDIATGKVKWADGKFSDASSLVYTADGRLLAWSNDGDVGLIEGAERSGGEYKELAFIRGVSADAAWPHLVVAQGSLFCRDKSGRLVCLALPR